MPTVISVNRYVQTMCIKVTASTIFVIYFTQNNYINVPLIFVGGFIETGCKHRCANILRSIRKPRNVSIFRPNTSKTLSRLII